LLLEPSLHAKKKNGEMIAVGEPADQERTVDNMAICQQPERATIKMVQGKVWSPGVYPALRMLGRSLDVAWEKAVISHF
jgi:hypothetical protein